MTTDSRLQALRREARSSGDPHSQARLLVERLRVADPCGECGGKRLTTPKSGPKAGRKDYAATCDACAGFGSVLRARVELAACSGSETAWIALPVLCPVEECGKDHRHERRDEKLLPDFLAGLSRWSASPFHAPVRAALAAANATAAIDGGPGMASALEGVAEWLGDPSAPFYRPGPDGYDLEGYPHWFNAFTSHLSLHGAVGRVGGVYTDWDVFWSGVACEHPRGEPAIRTAIQEALVTWSLGP